MSKKFSNNSFFKESISINGIKGGHFSLGKIDGLADRLGKTDKLAKHPFNKRKKVLLEAQKQRSVRHLTEPTKTAKFFTEIKKKDKQRICGNERKLMEFRRHKLSPEGFFSQKDKIAALRSM